MASPNFDELNLRLSREIDDPVAAAATSGDALTSAQRTVCLNTAHRRWMSKKIRVGDFYALRGYTYRETKALVARALTLGTTGGWTGGVAHIIAAVNTTLSKVVPKLPEGMVPDSAGSNINKYLAGSTTEPVYTVENGNFVQYGGGATDNISLFYVKPHSDLAVGGSDATVVYDAAFTVAPAGGGVTNFTGVLASHVGGTVVGTDSGGNLFSRSIVAYVSSTSFTMSSTVTATGTCTHGYIIPLNQADTVVPSEYWNEIIDEAVVVAYEQFLVSSESLAKIQMKKANG